MQEEMIKWYGKDRKEREVAHWSSQKRFYKDSKLHYSKCVTGVIESAPADESQDMGDPSKEPTDEERDQSDEKRSEAMRAFSEQQFDEAIKLYTEAIRLNPQSALLFAKRGQVCIFHSN